jgi:protein SCO1/2
MKIPSFSLVDHEGKPFTNQRLKGHWTLATIGFTYCPDVCPLTLAKIAEFYELLDKAGLSKKRPECAFISVDPYRDSRDVLGDYVTFYRQEFIGVTGSPEDIFHLVNGLGLYYGYSDPGGKLIIHDVLHRPNIPKYSVIHSTQLLFISPEGDVVAMITQPFEPARLMTIYKRLRNGHRGK